MPSIKGLFKFGFSVAKQTFEFCEEKVSHTILPALKSFVTDDAKVRRVTNLTYRFLPFPARFVVSKEKYSDFLIARKNWALRFARVEPVATPVED